MVAEHGLFMFWWRIHRLFQVFWPDNLIVSFHTSKWSPLFFQMNSSARGRFCFLQMLANLVADSLVAAIVLVRKKNCSKNLTPMVYFETNIMLHLWFKRYSTWPLLVLEMLTTNFDPLTRLKPFRFPSATGQQLQQPYNWALEKVWPRWGEVGGMSCQNVPASLSWKTCASRCYAPTRTMWRCNWSCPMHGWPDRMPKHKENKGAGTVKGKYEWGVSFDRSDRSVVSKIWKPAFHRPCYSSSHCTVRTPNGWMIGIWAVSMYIPWKQSFSVSSSHSCQRSTFHRTRPCRCGGVQISRADIWMWKDLMWYNFQLVNLKVEGVAWCS